MRGLALLLALALTAAPARAADPRIRIAEQFGLSYLPLRVAIDRRLIESEAARLGPSRA